MINHAVQVKQVQLAFIHGDELISNYFNNIFLAAKQIRRASLAGFGENNGVVYVKYHTSIIHITVLYVLITVLYESYTVQLCS